MIVNDQSATALFTSLLTLGLIACSNAPASADATPAVATDASPASTQAAAPVAPLRVLLSDSGREAVVTTAVRTVEGLLAERGIRVAPGDYLSADGATTLTPGMRVAYRPAEPVVLVDGGVKRTVRSSAATVGDLLSQERVSLGSRDQVFPEPRAYLAPNEVVRVDRVAAWTAHLEQRVAPRVQERFDTHLAAGVTKTVARGSAGVRVATVRYERRNDAPLTQRVLGYQVLKAARPRIVVHGARPFAALSDIAAQGFAGALHFAGAALHVLATAYTSTCYGCSGLTASGARAGLGVIAVDPRVIPLGTKLFIPGYGRAVAGDTGGAIVGHRIDLGFQSVASALRFGSREVTVYVVK